MIFKIKNFLVIFVFFIFFCISCSTKHPKIYVFDAKKKVNSVVILPLKNRTNNNTISRVIYRLLTTSLLNSSLFIVIEEGEVRNFLIKQKIFPGDTLSLNKLRKLKNKLNADIIIGGNVFLADDKGQNIRLGIILWARDIQTGKLLWTTYFIKTGDDYQKIFHFGKISSINFLANKMIKEIVLLLERKTQNN